VSANKAFLFSLSRIEIDSVIIVESGGLVKAHVVSRLAESVHRDIIVWLLTGRLDNSIN